ncbi:unnamed protein product, partial [Staurois parvus]
MGPPTDPGPSGSARVSKWSVRPWTGFRNPDMKTHYNAIKSIKIPFSVVTVGQALQN